MTEKEDDPGGGTSTLETVGKLILPASIACYFLGFLAAAPHYARAGVPVDVITPQTFLAAGLLFLVVTIYSGLMGVTLRKRLANKAASTRTSLLRSISTDFMLPIGFILVLSRNRNVLWGPLYVIFVGLLASIPPPGMTFSLKRSDLFPTTWNALRVIALGVTPIALFALLVYPSVPVGFGGGRPEVLLSTSTNQAPGADHDKWAAAGCRLGGTQPKASGPACRTIYKVYENPTHLFVAIREVPGACPLWPVEWLTWSPLSTSSGCFQRISNSDIPRLETPGQP
jgi:hypothetical protein